MFFFFFFNDTATTEIYTLSLHDALPICKASFRPPESVRALRAYHRQRQMVIRSAAAHVQHMPKALEQIDRKSTRLNSSHDQISYAVFCLKKKKKNKQTT